jgi:hypothetical protein
MSASMRYEDLLALRGRDCRLQPLGDDAAVELHAVLADVGERRERQGYEQFALVFRAQESGEPQQCIYAVTFDGDEAREMFLVPIGREGAQVSYEACFNRSAASTP